MSSSRSSLGASGRSHLLFLIHAFPSCRCGTPRCCCCLDSIAILTFDSFLICSPPLFLLFTKLSRPSACSPSSHRGTGGNGGNTTSSRVLLVFLIRCLWPMVSSCKFPSSPASIIVAMNLSNSTSGSLARTCPPSPSPIPSKVVSRSSMRSSPSTRAISGRQVNPVVLKPLKLAS